MSYARPFRLSRRAILRGASAGVALPWLEVMAPRQARAAAGDAPKRLLVWFTPNGTLREQWTPTGTETAFTLPRLLAPLAMFQQDLVVIDGVDNVVATKPGPGDGHMKGMGCMLTGTELQIGKTLGGSGTPAGLAGGISVDQEIVAKTKPNTRFPSLEVGVMAGSTGTVWGYSNYRGPGQALPLDNNPGSVWNRIFTDVGANPADTTPWDRSRAQRRSVLSGVMANYRLWADKLGTDDRRRLDQHLTNVQELEARVASATTAPLTPACARPAGPPPSANPAQPDFKNNDKFPDILKLQMDLVVMALQCDLTRVATLQLENSVGGARFTWLGATRGHHDLSHDPDTNLETIETLAKINEWLAVQFAYLLTKMKAVKEGSGTLLDNSLVFWVNELSRGNSHSNNDMPFVLAGRAGGALRTGRFLKFDKAAVPHNNLLVSVLNLFGVPATTFGNPAWCTGPLAGLA